MVFVFFGTGFEEVEALATVDVLKRAGKNVKMIGINGDEITGAHEITVKMDMTIEAFEVPENTEVMFLPGGVPGIHALKACEKLKDIVKNGLEKGIIVAAICAAPSVLTDWRLIDGKRVTAYPSFVDKLSHVEVVDEDVVVDGNLITGRGVGVAMQFALKIVEALDGAEIANDLSRKMVMPQ